MSGHSLRVGSGSAPRSRSPPPAPGLWNCRKRATGRRRPCRRTTHATSSQHAAPSPSSATRRAGRRAAISGRPRVLGKPRHQVFHGPVPFDSVARAAQQLQVALVVGTTTAARHHVVNLEHPVSGEAPISRLDSTPAPVVQPTTRSSGGGFLLRRVAAFFCPPRRAGRQGRHAKLPRAGRAPRRDWVQWESNTLVVPAASTSSASSSWSGRYWPPFKLSSYRP